MNRRDRGAVTAELALGLPLLLGVTVALVWLLALAAGQVRVVDGAREAARALARGDPEAVAFARAERVSGPGSAVSVVRGGGEVTVTVRRPVSPPGGLLGRLPAVVLAADAVAATEAGR
ncbi:TadE family type IV pilus minor pilin [Nocardioides coralli]|uniref:TadE family type IV pilus minor pilin n=1 Tax=Nocardioides coralli TaxID=2872154 RepID=UPI001CA3BC14|nr:TadE family type IV pilus minor pilin [Nocardioides coralli]QZY29381.1 pilus assembly protein [Nocardioides coralli]